MTPSWIPAEPAAAAVPFDRLSALGWGRTGAHWRPILFLMAVFAVVGSLLYFACGLGTWSPGARPLSRTWRLSAIYVLFPALAEELLWRWLLIPPRLFCRTSHALILIVLTTVIATLAHPLVAVTVAPHTRSVFCDPCFLAITALLQAACGLLYLLSRSIWPSVFLHWLTIVVWKFLYGGPFLFFAT